MLSVCKMLALTQKKSTAVGSWVSHSLIHLKIRTPALSGTSSQITSFLFIPPAHKKGITGQSRTAVVPDFPLDGDFIAMSSRAYIQDRVLRVTNEMDLCLFALVFFFT